MSEHGPAGHSGHVGHGQHHRGLSFTQQFRQLEALMATVQEQLDRLKGDVGNYIGLMRDKVSTLQTTINGLQQELADAQGNAGTAAAEQAAADAAALDSTLSDLEAAFAQDNPQPPAPTDGNTGDGGTGTTTDGGAVTGRR